MFTRRETEWYDTARDTRAALWQGEIRMKLVVALILADPRPWGGCPDHAEYVGRDSLHQRPPPNRNARAARQVRRSMMHHNTGVYWAAEARTVRSMMSLIDAIDRRTPASKKDHNILRHSSSALGYGAY